MLQEAFATFLEQASFSFVAQRANLWADIEGVSKVQRKMEKLTPYMTNNGKANPATVEWFPTKKQKNSDWVSLGMYAFNISITSI